MKRTLTTLLLILSLTAQAETGRIYITLTAAVKLQETKPYIVWVADNNR